MYYLFLIIATVLFSIQFVFNKVYQREAGETFVGSCCFLLISSLVFGVLMFAYNGFKLSFAPFSLLMAICNLIVSVGSGYFGIVALSISDLAKYSLYMMLGGMAMPFIYGFAFNGDAVTWQKLVCFVTIAAALYINASGSQKSEKGGWKAKLCYAAIFFFNGFSGVVATIHQNPAAGVAIVGTNDFTIWKMIVNVVFCGLVVLWGARCGQIKPLSAKALSAAGGYGVVNGIASVLLLISILHIEPSVQYPIVTGGCVILSVVFGLFFREKITLRNAICALVTLAGTLVLMIP